jgi:molybdopterin-guanine dinucleotide biosynthesis protein MobB
MMEVLLREQADIAVAHDGQRMQPVFCLIPCRLQADLEAYLKQGDRKIDLWFKRHKLAIVDFSDQAHNFVNFNTPQDLNNLAEPVASNLPLLGFSAYSGTGKTTLLTQLIPALNEKNIRVAVIKHAHHQFDVDIPGKDSYRIREAGSKQTLVASSRLLALMQTMEQDPKLAELIPRIDPETVDIILVEGFKQERFAKIELHRPSLGKPLLYTQDSTVIAIASDSAIELEREIDQLDINNITAIADYIDRFIENWTP